MHILLIGAGPMACEYAKVLQSMEIPFTVVGRSEKTVQAFKQTTGISAIAQGYEHYFAEKKQDLPTHCIIAVGEKRLGEATRAAIHAGIKNILVEKPGGIDAKDIREVARLAKEKHAEVYIGYNRRFYSSVLKTKEMIANDGGLLSFHFEFTEWGHVIAGLEKEEGVKENWFLANSSHVIDLAFYLGGTPTELNSFTKGSLDWHPRAAIYAGAGVSDKAALFSYQANWQAPGRWGLEFLTAQHRFYLRPLEKLQIQKLGSIAVEEYTLDDALDYDFKPGLYRQIQAFINTPTLLANIHEQCQMLAWYEKMNPPSAG